MIVNNKKNKQFVLGKGIVRQIHTVHPSIQHHNSGEIDQQILHKVDNLQIKDKTLTKGINNNLHLNNKLFLNKLISGGGFVKPS
jgi:hypothetical protein